MRPRQFEPQVHGCIACRDGRDPCDPEMQLNCAKREQYEQAQQSQDQEPFARPLIAGHPGGCYHCKGGTEDCICPAALGAKEAPRRYHPSGVYCSPAEEEAIRLNRVEEAVLENVLAADTQNLLTPGDMVNLPAHYARFKIEPIRFIVENGLNWFQGNIVKYGSRAQHKHATPLEDISKIIRYAEMWFDFESGDPDWWLPRGHPQRKPPVLA